MKVSISKIKPNPFNERKHVETILPLIKQIEKRGFIGTLLAREKDGKYEVAFGSRRLQAAKKAKIKEIDIEVRKLSDREMMTLTTAENSTQERVSPIERAKHVKTVIDKFGLTIRDASDELGIPKATIHDLLSLSELGQAGRKLVESGNIGWTQAVKAQAIGGEQFVKTAAEKRLKDEDIRDVRKAAEKATAEEKKALFSGDLHPEDLKVRQSLDRKKAHISMSDFARKAHRHVDDYLEVLDLIIEYWDDPAFPNLEKKFIKESIKMIKKRQQKLETKF